MITAIVAAAGLGKRFSRHDGKQFFQILGKPLLSYTLNVFQKSDIIDNVILVVNKKDILFTEEKIVQKYKYLKVFTIIEGGKERQDSIKNAIKHLPKDTGVVVIHDGARVLVTVDLIDKTLNSLEGWDGIAPGLPATNTLKRVLKGKVIETLDRSNIWEIQTPQVFKKNPLLESYRKAYQKDIYKTDDTGLLEQFGYRVGVVEGEVDNIKVTYPRDIYIVEAIIRKRSL